VAQRTEIFELIEGGQYFRQWNSRSSLAVMRNFSARFWMTPGADPAGSFRCNRQPIESPELRVIAYFTLANDGLDFNAMTAFALPNVAELNPTNCCRDVIAC
jgi:hypothetical protein